MSKRTESFTQCLTLHYYKYLSYLLQTNQSFVREVYLMIATKIVCLEETLKALRPSNIKLYFCFWFLYSNTEIIIIRMCLEVSRSTKHLLRNPLEQ